MSKVEKAEAEAKIKRAKVIVACKCICHKYQTAELSFSSPHHCCKYSRLPLWEA